MRLLLISLAAATLGGQDSLDAVDQAGNAAFAKRDCRSALESYERAAPIARSEGLSDRAGLIYRRIGVCKGRLGDITGSLDAYRSGVFVSETAKDPEILTENVHGLGLALQRLGQLEEALAPAEREYALARVCGHPEHLVRAMWLMASLYDRTGKRRVSMQMFEQALEISRKNKDRAATLILLDNLATRYAEAGDVDSGIRLEKEAISLSDPADPPAMANGYNNLGAMELLAKDYKKSRERFAEILRLATAPESWPLRQGAMKNMADIDLHFRNYDSALNFLDQALQMDRKLNRPEWESFIQEGRAKAFLSSGDLAQAGEAADEALRLGRQVGSPELVYSALFARGRIDVAQHRHDLAVAHLSDAVATAEALRAEGPGDQQTLRAAFQKRLPAYQTLVGELIATNDPEQALAVAEHAKSRVLMDLLLDRGFDERKSMSVDEVAQQRKLLVELAAANRAAAKNANGETRRNLENAMREEERFRRDIVTRHPELHLQSGEFEVATASQLQALLPNERTALLDFFQTSEDSIALFVVRRAKRGGEPRTNVFSVSPSRGHAIEPEALRFRAQLANRDLDYSTSAKRLYAQLIAPALSSLKNTDTLIISPDAALWNIPFQALMDTSSHHLIETHRISIAPSLTALYEIHKNRNHGWKLDLLALGDPSTSASQLPDAAREVEEIGARYPNSRLVERTGARATADEFRKSAPFARIVHVAAHADLNNGDPLYSSLRLAPGPGADNDGILTAREIMSIRIQAEMVILSACETALGKARPGEGMMGMGWALSAAGASSAVLSQWKVDSASAKDFMVALHERLAAHRGSEPRAESLRLAALERMRAPGRRHPFYWAGFQLWGDGS